MIWILIGIAALYVIVMGTMVLATQTDFFKFAGDDDSYAFHDEWR